MNSRVLILCGSLMLATGCDSPRLFSPTALVPPAPTPPPIATPPPPSGAAGPFGPASNPVIAAGALIEDTVTGDDPVCFYNWDATGHCRQFDFVSASDGVITATLTWTGPSRGLLYDPDVFLAAPDGQWDFAHDAWPEKHVTIRARSGVTYRVVVMSYGDAELRFGLRVDVQP
jgi:hypothetical protein